MSTTPKRVVPYEVKSTQANALMSAVQDAQLARDVRAFALRHCGSLSQHNYPVIPFAPRAVLTARDTWTNFGMIVDASTSGIFEPPHYFTKQQSEIVVTATLYSTAVIPMRFRVVVDDLDTSVASGTSYEMRPAFTGDASAVAGYQVGTDALNDTVQRYIAPVSVRVTPTVDSTRLCVVRPQIKLHTSNTGTAADQFEVKVLIQNMVIQDRHDESERG